MFSTTQSQLSFGAGFSFLSNTESKLDSFKPRLKNSGWLCRTQRRRIYISESTHYFGTRMSRSGTFLLYEASVKKDEQERRRKTFELLPTIL